MKKYTILTEDGTTGICRRQTMPEAGELVSIEVQDSNGWRSQVDGYCQVVLDEQDY